MTESTLLGGKGRMVSTFIGTKPLLCSSALKTVMPFLLLAIFQTKSSPDMAKDFGVRKIKTRQIK